MLRKILQLKIFRNEVLDYFENFQPGRKIAGKNRQFYFSSVRQLHKF
jgi:hypothetical protein